MQKLPELTPEPQSYWLESSPEPEFPQLDKEISVDVAIVGGGLTGISTAWHLQREGILVAVLEADKVGYGTTGHSTAKITAQHDLIYWQLKSQWGAELAQQYAQANAAAIAAMADLVNQLSIDCDFQWQPAYVYTLEDKYVTKIEQEAEAAASLGIEAEYLDNLELPFAVKAAVRFNGQAQFHPGEYTAALAAHFVREGGAIYPGTTAVGLEEGETVVTVFTQTSHKVRDDKVVIDSHFPFYDCLGLYFARMYPERSYILAVKGADRLPPGMYVTAESPGRSLRTHKAGDEELLLVAGEHHKTAHGEEETVHYERLRDFAGQYFGAQAIPWRWSAQDYTTADNIPYIGHIRPGCGNIFVATGFRKWGISTATVAAMLIRDLIVWGHSLWQDVYNPQRSLKLNAVGKLISLNADVAKELVWGKLSAAESGEIGRQEAKVVEVHGRKAGAYRDEEGRLHVVDNTCTHLGCELKWNPAEKTWDCPCHGSRFSYTGDIVEGPAVKPLRRLGEGASDIDPDII